MGAIFRKIPLGGKVVDEKCVSSSKNICGQIVAKSLEVEDNYNLF